MRTGLVFISIAVLQLAYSVEKASGMVSSWSEDGFLPTHSSHGYRLH